MKEARRATISGRAGFHLTDGALASRHVQRFNAACPILESISVLLAALRKWSSANKERVSAAPEPGNLPVIPPPVSPGGDPADKSGVRRLVCSLW
jgi:hypothetical protein